MDLAFNVISKIENIDHLVNLEKLYLLSNKIKKVGHLSINNIYLLYILKLENIPKFKNLSLFDVGSNKIQEIENLENIWYVKDLCFAKNKIKEIKNLDIFVNLESLALSVMNKFYYGIWNKNDII